VERQLARLRAVAGGYVNCNCASRHVSGGCCEYDAATHTAVEPRLAETTHHCKLEQLHMCG
jgi:hypothetical protein